MDEGDRLSLLALIVAVVALIVSGWQLAQQLFATATDGKRFCQGSVIGIWARKTRLSWRWSQIRFETKYTVPEIRLTSAIREEPNISHIPRTRYAYRIPAVRWLTAAFYGPRSDWDQWFELTDASNNVPWELRITQQPKVHITPRSSSETLSKLLLYFWDRSYADVSPDTVSWPLLLQRAGENQFASVSKTVKSVNGIQKSGKDVQRAEEGRSKPPRPQPQHCPQITDSEREQYEDRIVLRLKECSWDLIPPDVVRPLAKSTMGTVLVIAHRLGMTWQGDFSPSDGKINSAGCGHTFTGEIIRSQGLVIKYSFDTEPQRTSHKWSARRMLGPGEYLAPTETADKLHCGIISIDPKAIQQQPKAGEDIHLIDWQRKVDLTEMLLRLGVGSTEYKTLRDRERQNDYGVPNQRLKHSIEEAISILCPIAALPDSQARWIMWPYRSMRQPFTPTRQRQTGVEVLRSKLFDYIAADEQPQAVRILNERLHHLKHLAKKPLEYFDDLCRYYQSIGDLQGSKDADALHEMQAIYRNVQQIHEQTSYVFASVEALEAADPDEIRPFLFDVVAAQISLAVKYGKNADEIAVKGDGSSNDEPSSSDFKRRLRFVQELARLYVEDLDHSTIVKHIRGLGYDLGSPQIKALWWVLMLRSACWWISIRVKLPETQIPSYWYNSQMPVFIT